MITIADALIFAALSGIAVFMYLERSRLGILEEENNELWENLSMAISEIEELKEQINAPTQE